MRADWSTDAEKLDFRNLGKAEVRRPKVSSVTIDT